MPAKRALVLTTPVAAALLLAGCGSSDTAKSGTSSSSGGGNSSSAAQASPISGKELATKAEKAAKEAKTYHMVSKTRVSGTDLIVNSDLQYTDNGKINMKNESRTGPTEIQLIALNNGEKAWVKSPEKSYKVPDWTPITASSSNPMVKQMAGQMRTMSRQLANGNVFSTVQAASKFTPGEKTQKNGVDVTPYRGAIPASAIPNAAQAHISKPVPATVFLDDQDRVVNVTQTVASEGNTFTTVVDFSKYGEGKEITAPK